MAVPPVILSLATQVGMQIAKKVGASLGTKPDVSDRFKKVESLIATGITAVDAFCKVYGKDFHDALSEKLDRRSNEFTYEAGRSDYVRAEPAENNSHAILRTELNINLDRVSRMDLKSDVELRNYSLGIFREWMDRYNNLIGENDDSKETFMVMESLLDGGNRTFLDVFRLLQKTGLGTLGAILVSLAALIATSTGVGVIAAFSTWLFGIPMLQVGVLALGGAGLVAVSRKNFQFTNALSASVAAAYKLLDRSKDRADLIVKDS